MNFFLKSQNFLEAS